MPSPTCVPAQGGSRKGMRPIGNKPGRTSARPPRSPAGGFLCPKTSLLPSFPMAARTSPRLASTGTRSQNSPGTMLPGSTAATVRRLVPLAGKLLEVPQELIRTALDLELADGAVIADTVGDKPCVFLTGLYRAERGIAERLLQLGTGKLPWPSIDPDKAIP